MESEQNFAICFNTFFLPPGTLTRSTWNNMRASVYCGTRISLAGSFVNYICEHASADTRYHVDTNLCWVQPFITRFSGGKFGPDHPLYISKEEYDPQVCRCCKKACMKYPSEFVPYLHLTMLLWCPPCSAHRQRVASNCPRSLCEMFSSTLGPSTQQPTVCSGIIIKIKC